MLTYIELQKLDSKDLLAELKKARQDWLGSKLSVKMNQDKKSHLIQLNKRYIAQILTRLNELKTEQPTTEKPQEDKSKK